MFSSADPLFPSRICVSLSNPQVEILRRQALRFLNGIYLFLNRGHENPLRFLESLP